MSDEPILLSRAMSYANRTGKRIISTVVFGRGMEGSVWVTNIDSAVKVCRVRKNYADELECYRRLKAAEVHELCGFAVPLLLGFDDELLAIEMSIVQRPYLLDFGKVYLDGAHKRAYDKHELARNAATAMARYGNDWPKVAILLHVLETRFGIHYVDPRPVNIDCGASTKDDVDWDKEPDLDYSEYED